VSSIIRPEEKAMPADAEIRMIRENRLQKA
jgi:hypothetical protein